MGATKLSSYSVHNDLCQLVLHAAGRVDGSYADTEAISIVVKLHAVSGCDDPVLGHDRTTADCEAMRGRVNDPYITCFYNTFVFYKLVFNSFTFVICILRLFFRTFESLHFVHLSIFNKIYVITIFDQLHVNIFSLQLSRFAIRLLRLYIRNLIICTASAGVSPR